MPLLVVDNACLAYGDVALLDHTGFAMEPGERVALIGRNGTGKSSLLRALAGQSALDDGSVRLTSGARVAYVPQEPDFSLAHDVFTTVAEGLGAVAHLLAAYHAAALAVSIDASDAALAQLEELQHRLEAENGWVLQHRVEQVIERLKLQPDVQVSTLSGGGIKRVSLARALVSEPDLLLLDEPTNHLDIDVIAWLENLVRDFRGGIVVITHDRAFLDAVATRVLELDRGKLASFPGSFAEYQRRKAELLEAEAKASADFDKFLAQEEVWIRKGVEARRTRNEGRVKRLEDLRRRRAARREQIGQVNFALARGEESGQMVAELDGVGKCFDGRWVIRDFSTRILRGDRVGLIGPNGAGKTTLLKLILGELEPDVGTVRRGTRQQVAYFDQFRAQLDPEAALTTVISPGSDYVEIGGARKHVIGYLEDFLFAPSRARSPVKSLSGGERNRLLLARLFARPTNVLVLDEPTNDLDIETLELLEGLLQDYDGTIFVVSHDRAFLDNVVTQVIAAEGDGQWRDYVGGYSDWVRQRPTAREVELRSVSVPEIAQRQAAAVKPEKGRPQKLGYKEMRELESLPEKIAALEQEQSEITRQLSDASFYREKPDQAKALHIRFAAIEDELMRFLARWEELDKKKLAT